MDQGLTQILGKVKVEKDGGSQKLGAATKALEKGKET